MLGPAPSMVVVKLDHIGDFITALPAFQRLKESFPNAPIALLCAPFVHALAASTGLFEELHVYDFFGERRVSAGDARPEHVAEVRALRLPACDIAIDLRYDDDPRALLWGLDAKMRVGFAGPSAIHPRNLVAPDFRDSGASPSRAAASMPRRASSCRWRRWPPRARGGAMWVRPVAHQGRAGRGPM